MKVLAGKLSTIGLAIWWLSMPIALAQSPAKRPITFDSFNATYYLSRDSQNRSLLTTEEVIQADFPPNPGYYGITRAIPLKYQGHAVDVKINSVTDAAGDTIPFKTATNAQGDLVLTTGDPAITIYGYQTFRINYQTQNVVNTNLKNNQFLLDINGRGWDQPFGSVNGVIHIPQLFAASLVGKPSCYIAYLNNNSYDCTLTTKNSASETLVTVKSKGPVLPQHTLVAKMDFKTATFFVKGSFWQKYQWLAIGIGSLAVLVAIKFLWSRG